MSHPARLWNRSFVLWWLGSAQSSLGSTLAALALSFLVLHQTGSAGQMGVTLAIGMLPALLAPLAGTLADRLPLKLPILVGDLLRAAIQIGLGAWALHGQVPLLAINALTFINGVIGQAVQPAAMSVLPRLVPPDQITRASGLLASTGQFAGLLGLVGGGVLVSHVGSAPSLIADGVSFLVMAALLPFIALPARAASTGGSFWADFRGGLRYARSGLLTLMLPLIAFFINAALAPMEMLLPKRMLELGAGAQGYGLFFGLVTVGALLASLAASALNTRLPLRAGSLAGLLGIGLSLLLLALTATPIQMYAAALLFGLAVGVTNTSVGALFATIIAPEFRGRVASLMGAAGMIGMPLVLFALAPFADRFRMNSLLALAGAVTLAGAALWAYALARTPRAGRHSNPPPAPREPPLEGSL